MHKSATLQLSDTETCAAVRSETVWFQDDWEVQEAAAVKERKWLMSEQTLDKRVVQRLDFTRNLQSKKHLFLEVSVPAMHTHTHFCNGFMQLLSCMLVVSNDFSFSSFCRYTSLRC